MKLTKNYLRGLIQEQLQSSLNESQESWNRIRADRVRNAINVIKQSQDDKELRRALETLATHEEYVGRVLPNTKDLTDPYNDFHDAWMNEKIRTIDSKQAQALINVLRAVNLK